MKKIWLILFLSTVLILTGLPGAFAQESKPAAKAEFTLEEIVVTAERRETSALDTPVSVSAWDYETIDEQNIGGIMDLQMRMPSTFISNDRVTIRGVGRQALTLGTDPGVGIFVDGFYDPESRDAMDDLYDVERIENVRGPQSTLYGKSTIGGAINIIEKRPTKEWSGNAKITIGNYQRRNFQVAFGGPLPVMDKLFYRVLLQDKYYGGHVKSVFYSEDEYVGTEDRWRVEGKLLYEPTEYLNFYLRYNVNDSKERPYLTQIGNSYFIPTKEGAQSLAGDYNTFYSTITDNVTGLPGYGSFYRNPFFGITTENPSYTDPYKVNFNTLGHRGVDRSQIDLTATLDLADFTFKYLGMYRDWDLLQYIDYDYGPNPEAVKFQMSDYNTEEWSHELQVQYGGEDTRFSVFGGLYWYEKDRSDNWTLHYWGDQFWEFTPEYYPTSTPFGTFTPFRDNIVYGLFLNYKESSKAAFLQVDFDITDKLTLSLGGRYNVDTKKGDELRWYFYMYRLRAMFENKIPTINPLAAADGAQHGYDLTSQGYPGQMGYVDDDGSIIFTQPGQYLNYGFPYRSLTPRNGLPGPHQGDWAEWLWKISLDYKPAEPTLIYIMANKGYKPGGFPLSAFQSKNFDAEYCTSYEAGWKQQWANNRFNSTLGAFYYDYSDMQMQRRVGHELIIDNATAAYNYGVEVEAAGYIIERLLASISYSWLIAEFDDYKGAYDQFQPLRPPGNTNGFIDPVTSYWYQDLSGNKQPYSPEHKVSVQGTYTVPTNIGDFSVHGIFFWQSEAYMSEFNIPIRESDSYTRTDGELMWNSPAYSWRITLWMKNITDEEIIRYQSLGGPDTGFENRQTYADPRQFGIDIAYKW